MIWHRLFHRNPRTYPLPYGFGCRGCDRVRSGWIADQLDKGGAEARAMVMALNEHREFMRKHRL